MEEPVIIFQHIPKTAGTTLRYIIQYQFPPNAICELYGSSGPHAQRIDKLKNLPESQRKKIKIINTHLGFGLHHFLQQPYTYITFLREPVSRAISMYYYYQKTKNPRFLNLSLKEFIQTYGGVQNGMTKNLAGIVLQSQLSNNNKSQELCCTRKSLEIAQRNIQEHFKFIGISERFDESLLLLRKFLGWKIPLFDKSNISKKPKDIAQDTLKLIENLNELDLELYEYAKAIFEEMIERQGSSFNQELEEFQQANESIPNKLYYRVNTIYNRAANRIYKELVKS
ncbi:MAG: sulfotransferase family 2 domain-containing protein [Pleurocapsa sp. MO_192.B19]|nr:sulfotransferase family 2 domain-containing protein [Pleurocapsa sp. MO_192.B19]